jgi:glycosyltransferase involved in cell wall biosynthesis
MHVLVLPSWYSTLDAPWSGIFFRNQAIALAQAGVRLGVAFVEPRSLGSLSPSKLRESHFQVACSTERDVTTLRMMGWNTLGQTVAGARIWCALSERLVKAYVHRFGVPDVLHAHAALWAGRVAVRMGQTLSRPCVVTEHSSQVLLGVLGVIERREAARVYREADAVLAVSETLLTAVNSITETHVGRVVPNPVDFEFFTLPPVPRRREPFTFISVCNLVGGKRVDQLIRAFARVSQTCVGVRLVIVGAGVEAGDLRRLAQECGVEPQVEFTGGLPREEVRQRMWSANALVLPSAFETFGVVLVEALATGIPVVATRCGGPEEVVETGLGLLVERNNDEDLAEAMLSMTGQSYPEGRLRDRVMARFSFENVAQQLLNVYATLERQS